jgi:hypothetical protein
MADAEALGYRTAPPFAMHCTPQHLGNRDQQRQSARLQARKMTISYDPPSAPMLLDETVNLTAEQVFTMHCGGRVVVEQKPRRACSKRQGI